MNTFEERMQALRDERNKILASPIIARATLKQEGVPGVIIIAAFALSTRDQFWFTFTAKSARSPRRTWVLKNRDIVWQGKIMTISHMIAKNTHTNAIVKSTYRYPKGKRLFDSALDRVVNPLKYRTPLQNTETLSVTYVNRKLARKLRGSVPMGWGAR